MGGKACIRGLRVTVGLVVGLLATGRTREEILLAYPYLEPGDIDQSLLNGSSVRQSHSVRSSSVIAVTCICSAGYGASIAAALSFASSPGSTQRR